MIGKHTLGSGFRGVLSYLLREGMEGQEGEATVVGGVMGGRTARGLAREFAVFRRLDPQVRRPVFHASLRLPAEESLTDEQWRRVASDYLARMGYAGAAYIVVKHPQSHIHIVACRVRVDGSAVPTWKDRWRSLAAVEALERQYGLSSPAVRPSPGHRPVPSRVSAGERAMGERRGEPLPKEILAARLEEAIARSDGTREDFERSLAALGIDARWNIGRAGRVHGAAFTLVRYHGPLRASMKGSAIGPAFSWPRLASRLALRELEHRADLGKAYRAEAQRQQRSRTLPASRLPVLLRVNGQQDGDAVPAGGRSGPDTQQVPTAPSVAVVPDRLVQDVRTSLAQQRRWNGHQGEDAALRIAALRISREHPEADVPTVLAALEVVRPNLVAAFRGGQVALASQLDAARAQERAVTTQEDRDYGTR